MYRPACLHACKLCSYKGQFDLSQQNALSSVELASIAGRALGCLITMGKVTQADPGHASRHMKWTA